MYSFDVKGSFYLMSRSMSIPVVHRFLSALLNSHQVPENSITGMALFKKFIEFHEAGKYKHQMSVTTFGRALKDVAGIDKSRVRAGTAYKMDAEVLRRFLDESNQYDDDASLV